MEKGIDSPIEAFKNVTFSRFLCPALSFGLPVKLFFFGGTFQGGRCSLAAGDDHLNLIVIAGPYKKLVHHRTVVQVTFHL